MVQQQSELNSALPAMIQYLNIMKVEFCANFVMYKLYCVCCIVLLCTCVWCYTYIQFFEIWHQNLYYLPTYTPEKQPTVVGKWQTHV